MDDKGVFAKVVDWAIKIVMHLIIFAVLVILPLVLIEHALDSGNLGYAGLGITGLLVVVYLLYLNIFKPDRYKEVMGLDDDAIL